MGPIKKKKIGETYNCFFLSHFCPQDLKAAATFLLLPYCRGFLAQSNLHALETQKDFWFSLVGVEKVETSQANFETSFPHRNDCIAMHRQCSSVSSLASKQCVTPKSWPWTLPSSFSPVSPSIFFRLDLAKQICLVFYSFRVKGRLLCNSPVLMRTYGFVPRKAVAMLKMRKGSKKMHWKHKIS